ncbi:hypothetical protein ACHAW6_015223 [Cyclotella cf. meneghiniana]
MRFRESSILAAAVASCSLFTTVKSFAPPRVVSTQFHKQSGFNNNYCPPLAAGLPIISDWRYLSDGSISGTVTNHPTISDGDRITTSPIRDSSVVNENAVVQTKSGSKYKLGTVAWGATIPVLDSLKAKQQEAKAAAEAAKAEKARLAEAAKRKPATPPKAAVQATAKGTTVSAATSAKQLSAAELAKLAKSKFALTGATVGENGKYLLAGKPRQSSGRAAKIWTAYLADTNQPNIPAGFFEGDESKVEPVTIKLSPDVDRMRLENGNYNKVQSGLFIGRFVKKVDYIEYVPSSDRSLDRKVCALVIESGQYDLKALLSARQGNPLRGRALRDAAAAAGQCIQAVHSSNLVWTDLKTENFVVVGNANLFQEVNDSTGSTGLPGVKGIDLESVIPRGGNPIDYSPEACPPEFAKSFMAGEGAEFVLDYSYDIWSLGMMLYELSTGKAFFDKKSPSQVTKLLCSDSFEADVSDVPDGKLRDLIGKCLSLDPRKRPDITGFLLHPYFITTGFGPISF